MWQLADKQLLRVKDWPADGVEDGTGPWDICLVSRGCGG